MWPEEKACSSELSLQFNKHCGKPTLCACVLEKIGMKRERTGGENEEWKAFWSSITLPLINLSQANCVVWLWQRAHHKLGIRIFQISVCLPLLHVCPQHTLKAWFDPEVSHSIYLAPLCPPLAVQTWRTHRTARYYPDVTANPSSTDDTATTETSPGQAQRLGQAHMETKQRVSADRADPGGKRSHLSEPFNHPQQHQTVKAPT